MMTCFSRRHKRLHEIGGADMDVVKAHSKDQAIAKLDGREPVAKIVEVKNDGRYID